MVEDASNPPSNDLPNALPAEVLTSPSQSADTLPTLTKDTLPTLTNSQSADTLPTLTKQAVTVPSSSALRKGKPKRNQTSKKTAPRKAAPSKGKRKRAASIVESDTEDSDDGSSSSSSSSGEEEETSSEESKGLGSGEDDERCLPSLSRGTTRNTRRKTMDPKRLDRPEEPIEVAVTAFSTTPQVELAIPPRSSHPTSPDSTLPTSASSPIPAPAHATLPSLTMEAFPLLLDPKWPTWFAKAFQLLSARDLGPAFTQAIRQYIELERRHGFGIGGPHAGFKKQKRPAEVDWWVGRARTKSPEIKNASSFGAGWWAWWKLLQPGWRLVADVDGPLGPTHREQAKGEEGWSVMDKHGQNAFLTVLATLVWWESGLPGNGQDNPSWLAAVEDVGWVMSEVVDAR